MESNSLELPEKWVEKIEANAKSVSGHQPDEDSTPFRNGMYSGYKSGAMAYAQWLYTCQTNYAALKERYDNILATEDGHLSQTENVWQSGYAAGHEAGTDKMGRDCDKTVDNALHAARNDCQRKMNELQKENIEQYADLQAKCERYEKALVVIQKWQLPSTGKFWNDSDPATPMSYEACYGSNGVRDFMRNVANEALSAGEGDKGVADQQLFDKWVKENAVVMGESHWLIGSRHIRNIRDLKRVYKYLNQKEDKQ